MMWQSTVCHIELCSHFIHNYSVVLMALSFHMPMICFLSGHFVWKASQILYFCLFLHKLASNKPDKISAVTNLIDHTPRQKGLKELNGPGNFSFTGLHSISLVKSMRQWCISLGEVCILFLIKCWWSLNTGLSLYFSTSFLPECID